MSIRLGLIMTCLLLAACQAQREKFTSIWSPAEVAEDASAHPADYSNLLDNPLGKMHQPAEADAPNKLLTLTDVSGNREYLFTDSISQERGILTALIEFRYVRPQTLPANGMTYQYNQWREQIDCKNKVRILRTTTHYNLAGEIVDTIEYPLPKYKPAELAALSQPNDKVIQYVCERAGATGLAVGDAAVATTIKDDGKTSKVNQDKTDNKTKLVPNKKDKTKSEDKIKVDEKIDFISKGKAEMAGQRGEEKSIDKPITQTTEPSVEKNTTEQPEKNNDKNNKKKNNLKDKKDKVENETNKQPESDKKATTPEISVDVELLEGEVPLSPVYK